MIVEKTPEFPEKVIPEPLPKCERCGSQLRYGKENKCICMKKICEECGGLDDDHDDDCSLDE